MYDVQIPGPVKKQLKKLPKHIASRLLRVVKALAVNPRPEGVKKIKGEKDQYRVRLGNYRIVYRIDDGKLVILVVRIAHRSEIYKDLS